MLTDIDERLEQGPVAVSWTVRAPAVESVLSAGLEELQSRTEAVSIGSYPGKSGLGGDVAIVVRGVDHMEVKATAEQVLVLVKGKGFPAELLEGDGSNE